MPNATLSIDWALISAMGIRESKVQRDALKLESGFMLSQETAHGQKGKKWGRDTGPRYGVELNLYNHTSPSAFPTGYEPFDPSTITPVREAFYSACLTGMLMKIGGAEAYIIGQSTAAYKRLANSLMVSSMGYLKRQFVRQIVAGGGVGFSQWGTLNGIDYTGVNGGVFERTAAFAQSNTIGGISKGTYNYAIGWQNVLQDAANALGTHIWRLTLAMNQVRNHKATTTKHSWVLSTNASTNLARASNGQVMFVNGADLDLGRITPTYGGVKCYVEPQMPVSTATGGATTNTYPLSALLLDNEYIYPAFMEAPSAAGMKLPDGFFGVGEWERISGETLVMGCPIIVAGNLITEDMGSSAAIIRGESY